MRDSAFQIKDPGQEQGLFAARVVAAGVLILFAFGGLIARLVYLQVLNHQHFATLSEGNRVRIESIAPTRGLIFDRDGVLLAENVPSYQLELIPEQVEDMEGTLERLRELVSVRESDLERFRGLLERQRRFEPVPLRRQLSDEEVARFSVHRHEFPGVDIQARLARRYPLGELTAHATGYLGAITRPELERLDPSEYSGASVVGKTGLEATYEELLHGRTGSRRVETNAQGRRLRVLETADQPVPGADLILTLDADIQAAADKAMAGRRGAVVAIDPRTGGVLALVSKPAFDPNRFIGGIDRETYARLANDPREPLFNRAVRGRYPPGSTVKPFLGLAGLVENLINPDETVKCKGKFELPGQSRPYRDWKSHGDTDLGAAIAESCDVYFYKLALELRIDRMHDILTSFGMGRHTGIDLPGERSGLIPSREWKRQTRGLPWYPGETVITGIGQGFTLVTPIQLAHATAMLAGRGEGRRPHMLKSVRSASTGQVREAETESVSPLESATPEQWQRIIDGMERVVHGDKGTARHLGFNLDFRMAGKTGTAQVFTLGEDQEYKEEELAETLRDHALFIGFAPVETPRVAVAVIVEHGGSGSSTAGPVARRIIEAALAELEGQ